MINEKSIKEKNIYSCNSIEFDKLPKKLDSNQKTYSVIEFFKSQLRNMSFE